MDEFYRERTRAFLDGFVAGGDILGLMWSDIRGDTRSLGYNALNFSLNYDRLGDKERSFTPRSKSYSGQSSMDIASKILGFAAGLGVNVATLGLLNVMYLGEVYCVDSEARKHIK